MTIDEVSAIISQYEKHGWRLRRMLIADLPLSAEVQAKYPGVETGTAAGDGLWFTRISRPGEEAWELRRLSGSPFALVTVFSGDSSHDEREGQLRETERRMFESETRGQLSH